MSNAGFREKKPTGQDTFSVSSIPFIKAHTSD